MSRFKTPVAFSHDFVCEWLFIASHRAPLQSLSATVAVFLKQPHPERPPSQSRLVRIGEHPLLERDSDHESWMILWEEFRFLSNFVPCPLRIELHQGARGRNDHYKIQIPPDAAKPRATRWRTLFAGELTDDIESFFTELHSEFVTMLHIDPKTGKPKRRQKPPVNQRFGG